MAETQTQPLGAYAADAVRAASEARGEPGWLAEKRQEAARAFEALPMPTQRSRPWKYTDVSGLSIAAHPPEASFLPVVAVPEGGVPAGGYAGSLADALQDERLAAVVEQHLGALIPATEGKFIAANASQWTGGVFVHAARGKAFEAPVTVGVTAQAGAVFPRMLIVAEAASDVTVLVRCSSGDADVLASGVVEIVAGADSNVRVVFDVGWGAATRDFLSLRARTDRGANVQVATLAIGGALVKHTLEGILEGEGSTGRFRGVALGDKDQHFDFVTLQNHIGRKTLSDVQIKAALAGGSRSIYYGVTRVEETAAGAAAEQENRNLLLSGDAKADSDPVLEILTNEVIRCGHGATVGPVDEEALFYLQSRGLDRRQSLKLLVSGFFRSVLDDIADEALLEEVTASVERKLEVARL
ncbi:MAG: Fe-S cluster assembly protein SufD [Dehalococcoidia bacterium]|nr:Fe-S cluster assembly protein SufD [Dehalococcoidia bacterium]